MKHTITEIRKAIRSKRSWPGGYPMYLVMGDSEAMCMSCAKSNWAKIARLLKQESSK